MCGGGSVKSLFHGAEDVGAGLLGNAVGGPLGAAALTGLTGAAQGGSLSSDLIGAGTAGAGAGIGDLLTGASLTGGGLDSLGSMGSTISNALGIGGDASAGTDVAAQSAGGNSFAPIDNASGAIGGPTGSLAGTGGASAGAAAPLGADDQSFVNQAVQSSGAANPANIAAGTPSTGIMSTISNALGGSGGSLGTAAKYAVPLAAVGSNLISQFKTPKGENQLLTAGSNALSTEQGLINTLQSGQLPPGEQSVINQGLTDSQNAIKAKYASLGLTGSTMEQQALQAASQDAQTQATNYATQATQTGLQAVGATGSIYSNIMNSILGQNNSLTNALAKLGSSGVAAP